MKIQKLILLLCLSFPFVVIGQCPITIVEQNDTTSCDQFVLPDIEVSTGTADSVGYSVPNTMGGNDTLSPGATVTSSGMIISFAYAIDAVPDTILCIDRDTFELTIGQTPDIMISSDPTDATICNGDTATLSVTPSSDDYSYSWSGTILTGSTSSEVEVFPTMTSMYSVTVTETATGCFSEGSIEVMVNDTPSIVMMSTATTCGAANGSASVMASGGQPGYTYLWSNNATTEMIENISAGNYTVTVTDMNSCSGIGSATVSGSSDDTPPTITCPDPVTLDTEEGMCVWEFFQDELGIPIVTDDCIRDEDIMITTSSMDDLDPGVHTVEWIATDTSGNMDTCDQEVTVIDNEKPSFTCPEDFTICEEVEIVLTDPDDLADNCDDLDMIVLRIDEPEYEIGVNEVEWTAVDQSMNDSTCTQIVTVIALPDFLEIDGPECEPSLETYIVVVEVTMDAVVTSLEGMVEDIGDGSWRISTDTSTDLTIIATNMNGCTDTLRIDAPNCNCPPLDAPESTGDVEFCTGDTPLPTISVTVDGGLTADWYDTSTDGVPLLMNSLEYTPTSAGSYFVEARDPVSGCISSIRTEITVTENPLPEPVIMGENEICEGDDLTLSTTQEYSAYTWSDGGGIMREATFTNITTDRSFSVTVTDDKGCEGFATFDVQVTESRTFYRDEDDDEFGDPNVSLQACSMPMGYVENSEDCNDNDDTVYPGAPELCDGQINNCNTGSLPLNEVDNDGDGYVECEIDENGWDGTDPDILGGDCNDESTNINPGAEEMCNGRDDDCDGAVDTDDDDFVDDEAPTCGTPQSFTVFLDENGNGEFDANQISILENEFSDNCGLMDWSRPNFTCNDLGTQNREINLEDMRDNSTPCAVEVTVVDNRDPEVLTSNCSSTPFEILIEEGGTRRVEPRDLITDLRDNCTDSEDLELLFNGTVDFLDYDCSNSGDIVALNITVRDSSGNNISVPCSFEITGGIEADASFPVDYVNGICEGAQLVLSSSFEGIFQTDAMYEWSNGNGEIVNTNTSNPDLIFNSAEQANEDTYSVRIIATNGCEDMASLNSSVNVWLNPTAEIGILSDPPSPPLPPNEDIILSADASAMEPGSMIDIYMWEFEDGLPEESMESQPTFQFTEEGIKDVSLKVTDSNGCMFSTEDEYIVGNSCFVDINESEEDDFEFCFGDSIAYELIIQLQNSSGICAVLERNVLDENGAPISSLSTTELVCLNGREDDCENNDNCMNSNTCDRVIANPIGQPNQSNFEISIEAVLSPGEYTLEYSLVTCELQSEVCMSSDRQPFTVLDLPMAELVDIPDTICNGGKIEPTLQINNSNGSGELDVIVSRQFENHPIVVVGPRSFGDGEPIPLDFEDDDLTDAGIWTISLVELSDGNCTNELSPPLSYTTTVLPPFTIQDTVGKPDDDQGIPITFNISGGAPPYTLSLISDNGAGDTILVGSDLSTIVDLEYDLPCDSLEAGQFELFTILVEDANGCIQPSMDPLRINANACLCDSNKAGNIEFATTQSREPIQVCVGDDFSIQLEANNNNPGFEEDTVIAVVFDPSDPNNNITNPIAIQPGVKMINESVTFQYSDIGDDFIGRELSVGFVRGILEGDYVDFDRCLASSNFLQVTYFATADLDVGSNVICGGVDSVTVNIESTFAPNSGDGVLTIRYNYVDIDGNMISGGMRNVNVNVTNSSQERRFLPFDVPDNAVGIIITSIGYADSDLSSCTSSLNERVDFIDFGLSIVGEDIICERQLTSQAYRLDFDANQFDPVNANYTWSTEPINGNESEDPRIIPDANASEIRVEWRSVSPGETPTRVLVSAEYEGCTQNASISYSNVSGNRSPIARPLFIRGSDASGIYILDIPALDLSGNEVDPDNIEAPDKYCFGRSPKSVINNPLMDEALPNNDPELDRNIYPISAADLDTTNFVYWVEIIPDNADFIAPVLQNGCRTESEICNTRIYANGIYRQSFFQVPTPDFDLEMNVFPNPNQGMMTISLDGSFDGPINYSISNHLGQLVNQGVWNKLIGYQEFSLTVPHWTPGVYYLTTYNESQNLEAIKIIIQ